MSGWEAIGGIGNALGGVGSIVSAIGNIDIGNKNLQAQKEQFDWMKGAQEKTWQREDTATQRKVADLKASGLSPVLAAGSASPVSGPIQVKAPQREPIPDVGEGISKVSDSVNQFLALSQMQEQISNTRAQRKLIEAQEGRVNAEKDRIQWDTDFYRKKGLPSNTNGLFKGIAEGLGFGEASPTFVTQLEEFYDKWFNFSRGKTSESSKESLEEMEKNFLDKLKFKQGASGGY